MTKRSTDFSNVKENEFDKKATFNLQIGSDFKKMPSKSAEKGYILSSNQKTGQADFRIRTQGKRVSEVAQKMIEQ